MKASRANYVEDQEMLQLGAAQKRIEKENGRLIEEMIYGAPKGGEIVIASRAHDSAFMLPQWKHPFWSTSGWRTSGCM